MARIYAKFDHGTEPGLEALTTGNFYERRVIGANTSSFTLRAVLIASRSALSTAMYAQLDDVNKDGSRGVIIPADVITSGSGNLLWTNVYTSSIAGVVWPSDPRVRPTASILSTNSNVGPANPVDGGTILIGYYHSASAALNDIIQSNILDQRFSYINCGPYTRLGYNASRTLHSIWHDHDLTYFAWDDFTPGTPQSLGASASPSTQYLEGTDTLIVTMSWTPEYVSDRAGKTHITASFIRQDNSAVVASLSDQQITNGDISYAWAIPGSSFSTIPYVYDVITSASFRDAVITTHQGPTAQVKNTSVVTVQRVYAVTNTRYGTTQQNLCDDTTNQTTYANNVTIVGSTLLLSDKSGNNASAGYYTDAGSNINGGSAVFWDGGAASAVTLTCT